MATPNNHHHQQQEIELYPGFRFHPTDEELITQYLAPKLHDPSFNPIAMGEADLNKLEPWQLPGVAKMGEEEWYFFCLRDRKYPTGMRTNRATKSGYWKATGKDKHIYSAKSLVGMKKTLVFYRGRAPKGLKTNWVIHEYRLEGIFSPLTLPNTPKSDWVISRVFNKSSSGKKTHISALRGLNSHNDEDDHEVKVFQEPSLPRLTLPRLTEYSPSDSVFDTKSTVEISSFVENNQASSFLGDDHYPTSSLPLGSYPDDLHYMDFIANMSANEPLELDCLLNY